MEGLLRELGVNWKLLLTQGVNFFVLVLALTFLLYRPFLRVMEERRRRIEFGLEGAREAERRLREIDEERARRLSLAEREAVGLIGSAEKDADLRAQKIVAAAEVRAEAALAEASRIAEQKRLEGMHRLTAQAEDLVRVALEKTVRLDPKLIDGELIRQAVEAVAKERL